MSEITCKCDHCPQRIVFDDQRVGEVVVCPGCDMETTLHRVIPPSEPLPVAPTPTRERKVAAGSHVCTRCGTAMVPRMGFKGAAWVELLLWVGLGALAFTQAYRAASWTEIAGWALLLLPALAYTSWRGATTVYNCTQCDSAEVVPIESPAGSKLMDGFDNVLAKPAPKRWVKLTTIGKLMAALTLMIVTLMVLTAWAAAKTNGKF